MFICCYLASPRHSLLIVEHVLCRSDVAVGSYRSFFVLLKFIGEKARLYRMTANALVEATVRSKNQMLEISNTPPTVFLFP